MAFKKGEKAPKAEKQPKEKGSSDYKPFWVVMAEKRAANKPIKRENSIPREKMSREDQIKLIGCTGILIATIVLFVLGSKAANRAAKTPAEIAREAAANAKDKSPKEQEE